jgi:hypothetical protein
VDTPAPHARAVYVAVAGSAERAATVGVAGVAAFGEDAAEWYLPVVSDDGPLAADLAGVLVACEY